MLNIRPGFPNILSYKRAVAMVGAHSRVSDAYKLIAVALESDPPPQKKNFTGIIWKGETFDTKSNIWEIS